MTAPLLDVCALAVHFPGRGRLLGRARPDVRAVDGVSFALDPGDTLGLVGESGCGKTTTARAILRLVEPTAGSVRFRGRDVLAMTEGELRRFRRHAQMVFQDPFSSLNPRMSVRRALEEVLRVHGLHSGKEARRRRVDELLGLVGLSPREGDRYPHEFSGGQRQRIAVARALAVEPDLLVLDEPVSALDVSVQAQILNLLQDLQHELGLTYLFISHDLAVVEQMSDRVAVMYLGRIVEIASAEGLYRNPKHPYTRALLSAVPHPDPGRKAAGRRVLLEGDPPSPLRPPPGCAFHPRCPHPAKDEECRRVLPGLEEKDPAHRAACIKLSVHGSGGAEEGPRTAGARSAPTEERRGT